MIPKLSQSQRFIEDCKKYQEKIDAVEDTSVRLSLERLFKQLKEQVSYIDRSHGQIILTGRMGDDISDIRSNITSIKKSLDTKLDQIDRSKFVVKPALRPNEE